MAITKPDVDFPPIHYEQDTKCHCIQIEEIDVVNHIHKVCGGQTDIIFKIKRKKKE